MGTEVLVWVSLAPTGSCWMIAREGEEARRLYGLGGMVAKFLGLEAWLHWHELPWLHFPCQKSMQIVGIPTIGARTSPARMPEAGKGGAGAVCAALTVPARRISSPGGSGHPGVRGSVSPTAAPAA